MKRSMIVLPLTFCFISGCGDSSIPIPLDEVNTNICGTPYELTRELSHVSTTSSHWISNKSSNPKLTIATSLFDSNASQTLSTNNKTCIHTADVLGSITRDVWQGDNEIYVNKGGYFSYSPVLTMHFKQPEFDSYQDWLNAGSPSKVDAKLAQSDFAIWYQPSSQIRFALADETEYLKVLPLQCSGFPFKLSLTTESYSAEDVQGLDLNFCDRELENGEVRYNCLQAAIDTQSISGKCDFIRASIALPDNKGDYQAISISGNIALNEMQPVTLLINNVAF